MTNDTQKKVEDVATQLGSVMHTVLPPETRFFLLVFDDSGWWHSVAHGERREIAQFLRKLSDELEASGP